MKPPDDWNLMVQAFKNKTFTGEMKRAFFQIDGPGNLSL